MATSSNYVSMLLVGDQKAGKSSIFHRFKNHSFIDTYYSTSVQNSHPKDLYCSWGDVRVDLVDIQDQLKYPKQGNAGYHYDGAILVIDLTNPHSFNNVKKHLEALKNDFSFYKIKNSTNIILVGTKADLPNERCVLPEDIENLRRELNCEYLEVSAKTGENVQQIFTHLATRVMQKRSPDLFKKPEAKPAGVFDTVANGFRSLFNSKTTTTSKPSSPTQSKELQRPAMLPPREVPTQQRSTSESHSAVNIAKFNYLQDDYFSLVAKVPGAYSKVLQQNNIQSLIQEAPLGKSKRGWNLLHFLAYSDDRKSVESLNERVTLREWEGLLAGQTYGSKVTPLTIAIQQKNWDMVDVLLDLGAEQTMENRQAILKRYESERQSLSQGRGDVAGPSSYANMRSQGMSVPSVDPTPSAPAEESSVTSMRNFQPQGVNMTSVANGEGNISRITPSAPAEESSVRSMRNFQPPQEQNLYAKEFIDAIAAGNLNTVSEKLTSGVTPKLLKTGLHCAIKHNQVDMVTLLIAYGAEVTDTALGIAHQQKNSHMLKVLTGGDVEENNSFAEAVNHGPNLSLFAFSR